MPAGLVVRVGEEPRFIPSSVVQSVEYGVTQSEVPGSELRVALVREQVIAVVSLGSVNKHLVVCRVSGTVIGLVGLEVLEAGELSSPGVELIPELDVAGLVRQLHRRLESPAMSEGEWIR
jgi:hypothetical protein